MICNKCKSVYYKIKAILFVYVIGGFPHVLCNNTMCAIHFRHFVSGVDAKTLQKKWKNLRDTFCRKHQESTVYTPSGSGTAKKPEQWKFYNAMTFLLPTIEFRKYVIIIYYIYYNYLTV